MPLLGSANIEWELSSVYSFRGNAIPVCSSQHQQELSVYNVFNLSSYVVWEGDNKQLRTDARVSVTKSAMYGH